jgi:hypothetical protein
MTRLSFELGNEARPSKVTSFPRFRAFPDDTGMALEGDKPVAFVGPILKLLDGEVIAGLAAGTAAEECPRDIDHMRRALALVKQRRPAPGAEASGRLFVRILEASDASLALHHPGVLAPTADIGLRPAALWRSILEAICVAELKIGQQRAAGLNVLPQHVERCPSSAHLLRQMGMARDPCTHVGRTPLLSLCVAG